MIGRLSRRTARIGIFGVAHGTYWRQFEGLYDNIKGYHNDFINKVAELPEKSYTYRFYLHDPWWANSPWFDRYGSNPHDIYLPLAVTRINRDGKVNNPDKLNILTIDNSFGEMPDSFAFETIPHFVKALKDSPDEPSPFVWIYPFSEYSDAREDDLLEEMFYNDWFIRGVINNGMPLSSVISTENFISLCNRGSFYDSVMVSPVPQMDSLLESAVIDYINAGGKILLYGSLKKAGHSLLDTLGLRTGKERYGEFVMSDIDGSTQRIYCAEFVNNGGLDTYKKCEDTAVLASTGEIVLAVKANNAVWIRGLTSYKSIDSNGWLDHLDLRRYYKAENMMLIKILRR